MKVGFWASAIFLALFTLFWSSLVILFDVVILRNGYKQLHFGSFPTTAARITHSEVTNKPGKKGSRTYSAQITYTYSVGDQNFSSSRIRFGSDGSSDSGYWNAVVRSHPQASETTIHYNPSNPSESVLLAGLDGSDYFLLLFLTPFNAVMLALWSVPCSWLRISLLKAPAGGRKVIIDGMCQRVRVSGTTPLAVGAVTLGFAAFISIFLVGFTAGFHPSLVLIRIVWGIVLGLAFGAMLLQHRKLASGSEDLVLNPVKRTVRLPDSCKDFPGPREIGYDDVLDVVVRDISRRDRDGDNTRAFAPALQLRNGDYRHLGEFYWSSRAEAFAEWLRDQMSIPKYGRVTTPSNPSPLSASQDD